MRELSLNILDIAQNGIAAGAPLIEISLSQTGYLLSVVIKDNGCGMSSEVLEKVVDPFYTSRKTRNVGLGLPFYKMAAEQCGGSFDIKSEVGIGTIVTATFNLDHIDCMPLGDIVSTFVLLIEANPHLDFIFKRKLDGKEYSLETTQMRLELEEVPLNNPEVVAFIRDYLLENENNLSEV